jgi:hypothetical protein
VAVWIGWWDPTFQRSVVSILRAEALQQKNIRIATTVEVLKSHKDDPVSSTEKNFGTSNREPKKIQ